MANGKELITTILLKGKTDKSLDAAFQAAESKAAKIMKSLPKNIGGIMATAGKAAAAGVTAATGAAAAFAASSVKVGASFDTAMSQVAATMGKTNAQMMGEVGEVDLAWGHFSGNLRDYAQEMGANTAFSATQAAEALNYMALAGYDTQKSMEMLPNVMNLAAAGAMDLAQASDMVTDASSALGLTTEQTSIMVDQMAQASSKSNTSVEQLGEAILTVGGTAANMAGGTNELSTALGILADNGIKASEGGTHLRNMMLSLQKARSSEAANWFKELGIQAYDDAGNLRSLGDVFKELNASMAGMSNKEVDKVLSDIFKLTDLSAARAMLANTKSGLTDIDDQLMHSGIVWENYKDTALLAEDGISGLATQIVSDFESAGMTAAEIQEEIRSQYGMTEADAATAVETLRRAFYEDTTRWDSLSQSISEAWYSTAGFESAALKAGTSADIMAQNLAQFGLTAEDIDAAARQSEQSAEGMIESLREWSDNGASTDEIMKALGMTTEELQGILDGTTGAAQAMADTQLDNLNGDITLMKSALEGVQIVVSDKLSPSLREFVQFGTSGLSRITSALKQDGLNAALEEFGSLLSEGLTMVITGLPDAINAGVTLLEAIGKSIVDNADTILDAAGTTVMAFIDGIVTLLPKLGKGAALILSKIAKEIGRLAPDVLPKAARAITQTIVEILKNADALIDGAVAILSGLAQGIIDSLPVIAEAAPEILAELAAALIRNPEVILAGAGLKIAGVLKSSITSKLSGIGSKVLSAMNANIGAAVTEGTFAASAATIGGAIAAAVGAWLIGSKIGNELGKALFPDDAELYENFHWFGEGGFFDQMSGDLDSTMDDIAGAFELWGEDISNAIAPAFEGINHDADQFFKNIDDNWGLLGKFFEDTAASASTSWQEIPSAFQEVSGAIDEMAAGANAAFDAFFQSVEMVKTNTVNAVALTAQELQLKFGEILTYIQTTFTAAWQGAWDGITSFVSNAFNNVKGVVVKVLSSIVQAVNKLIGGINTASSVVGLPAIPLIPVPKFAQGGTVTSPTLAMVGEAGTETIVPHNNSDRSRSLLREAAAGVYGSQASRGFGNSYNITFAPTINGGGDPEEVAEIAMSKFRTWYEQMRRDDMREAYAGL